MNILTSSKNLLFLLLISLTILLSSCELVGDIFEAGIGVGVFAILGILVLVGWLIMRMRK